VANGMVGAADRVLDVADHGVHLAQIEQLDARGAAAGDVRGVGAAGVVDGTKTRQTIGDDVASREQMAFGPAGDLPLTKSRQPAQAHRGGLTGISDSHRNHERDFVRGPAAALATASFAAPVDIIDLDEPAQRLAIISLLHDLHELVLHAPGGVAGDAQLAVQSQGGDAVF